MRYWDELLREQRGDMEIVVDKSWEDCRIRDLFDESCCDIEDLERKVNNGDLDWFMLRARVFVEGLEVGEHICGGFLYEDAREVLKDGMAEDLIYGAMEEAKGKFYKLSRVFGGLSAAVDNQTI
jgi:hypothetical protein